MTLNDLRNAIEFLRRIPVGRLDEERLIITVQALEHEIERRQRERRKHAG
jgi:hypothetical protein